MAKRISKAERADFATYLRQCTDQQVRGVFENEKEARRQVYTNLARAEAARRGITLDE
jgi:hypothetical protein